MDTEVPPTFHTLNFMSCGYSYWVKLKDGTCGATLTLEGESLPCSTPLDYWNAGWNYVGYLPNVGFYDGSLPTDDCLYVTPQVWEEKPAPVAQHVLQSISGQYSWIQGACCGGAAIVYDPTLAPSFSNLHCFGVGNGYLLKLSEDATLTYPCDAVTSTTVPRRVVRRRQPTEAVGVKLTNRVMFLHGTVTVNQQPAAPGSLILVATKNGLTCGVGRVIQNGYFQCLAIYGDDLTTPEMDGAVDGAELLVTVNGQVADAGLPLRWLGQYAVQQVELRVQQNQMPAPFALGQNCPNPCNPETWIPYQLTEPATVTLQIYSLDGRVVRTLRLGLKPAGMYQSKGRAIYWDGRNESGEKVSSGVYFYHLTAGRFSSTKRMLLIK
jgi:hypothetical protein